MLRFPASANISSKVLKKAARSVLRAVFHPCIVGRLRRLVRVVRTRAVTIGGVLHNWRPACAVFDPKLPAKCSCAHYPPEWRDSCPPDVLAVHGHFCILNTKYAGPGVECMRVSHKTPITYASGDLEQEARTTLRDLHEGLPPGIQPFLDGERVGPLCRAGANACAVALPPALGESAAVSMGEVLKCRKYLRRAIRSEVDKGPGLTCIYCPVANWHLMHLVWPSEPGRCKVLEMSEFDILWQDIQEFHKRGWSRLCKLFGVSADDFPTARSSLPHCYGTWKLKAFLKQILKGRPISPHTRIPLKVLYNMMATAHAFLLGRIRTGRVSRMFTCKEFATRLECEMKALEAKCGFRLCAYTEIGDLSEMYTNLYHTDCDSSLRRNVDRYRASGSDIGGHNMRSREYICMPKRGAKIANCRPGQSYDDDHVTVSLQDIVDVAEYSNSRSIMFVGTELRQYTQGIPMGEQGSCAKANGVALDAELRCDAEREETHGDSERNLSLQYVDDGYNKIVYSEEGCMGWTRESAVEYATQVRECYPHPLFMETEPQGQGAYRFLETDAYLPDEHTSYTVHHNRPWTGRSYNMAASGGSLFYSTELATAVNTCARTVDNTTPLTRSDAAGRIAARLREMLHAVGPGFSDSFVRHVLQRFGDSKDQVYVEWMRQYGAVVRALIWPMTLRGKP